LCFLDHFFCDSCWESQIYLHWKPQNSQ
jgi:hypothetical protein